MNYEKMFYADIRDKKRIARGVHNKKGLRGYVGKVKFTSDLLKGKAKRDYQKSSKVVSFNMYDNLMDYNSFLEMEEGKQKKTIEEYRKRFTNNEIMKTWGINEYEYYSKLLKKLGIKTNSSGNRKRRTSSTKEVKQPAVTATASEPELPDGLHIKMNGSYNAGQIQSKLEKLALMLEEENEYNIHITISEKSK